MEGFYVDVVGTSDSTYPESSRNLGRFGPFDSRDSVVGTLKQKGWKIAYEDDPDTWILRPNDGKVRAYIACIHTLPQPLNSPEQLPSTK